MNKYIYPPGSGEATDSGSSATAGAASIILKGRNDLRGLLLIVNDGVNTVYLAKGNVAFANSGIALLPNGAYSCGRMDANDKYCGAISAISPGGAVNVIMTEQNVPIGSEGE